MKYFPNVNFLQWENNSLETVFDDQIKTNKIRKLKIIVKEFSEEMKEVAELFHNLEDIYIVQEHGLDVVHLNNLCHTEHITFEIRSLIIDLCDFKIESCGKAHTNVVYSLKFPRSTKSLLQTFKLFNDCPFETINFHVNTLASVITLEEIYENGENNSFGKFEL